ncbi:hypothetical protein [Rhodococcus sp. NPDC127528]|uniref:hypothetical protein n=1 Tax=unclassified Rhodococcus (in: high G+C Gram-positive bacteria) TaxID=192944 RepID=UPI0036313A2B
MGIRGRLRARGRERRRAWSQRVLGVVALMIEADATTDLISAVVDADPEFVRIVYRSRWWPRVLGYRGHVPAPGRRDSARDYAEHCRLAVCEPLGARADVLTVDGGIEWWGDGYPSPHLSPEHAGSTRTLDTATLDDDEAWASWRKRRLTPVTDTTAAHWLTQSTQAAHDGYPARAVLRHPDGPAGYGIADLPAAGLDALCAVLARHTTTADECWLCVWDGYAWVHDTPGSFTPYLREGETAPPPPKPALPAMIRNGPRATIDQFDYVLFSGPVTAAPRMGWYGTPQWLWVEWPNLIWPTDRAWFAESGIDDDWLDLSGPRALIDELDTIEGVAIERLH